MKDRLHCTTETMYNLKDQLLAVDRKYMFQTMEEIEVFLSTKSLHYIKDWISIWYPFFKSSIWDSQRLAFKGVLPITNYFKLKTLGEFSRLPKRHMLHYNGLKCDQKTGKKKASVPQMKQLYKYFPRK